MSKNKGGIGKQYTYPLIPKEYYPAVLFACKIIRETGFFNKAVDRASRYYGVDPEELKKHIRARQGAGQRAANKKKKAANKGKKFHWYVVEYSFGRGEYLNYFDEHSAKYTVRKATSSKNAWFGMLDRYERRYGEMADGLAHYFGEIEEFDTEAEAIERCEEKRLAKAEETE